MYALLSYDHNYNLTYSNYNLSDFSIFYRPFIKSGIEDVTKKIIKKCEPGYYQLEHNIRDYDLLIFGYADKNYTIIITDTKYPEYRSKELLLNVSKNTLTQIELDKMFETYQHPDKLTEIKKELEETKKIVMDNVDKLLLRQGSLDELLEKANALQISSEDFVDSTNNLNRCCIIS